MARRSHRRLSEMSTNANHRERLHWRPPMEFRCGRGMPHRGPRDASDNQPSAARTTAQLPRAVPVSPDQFTSTLEGKGGQTARKGISPMPQCKLHRTLLHDARRPSFEARTKSLGSQEASVVVSSWSHAQTATDFSTWGSTPGSWNTRGSRPPTKQGPSGPPLNS